MRRYFDISSSDSWLGLSLGEAWHARASSRGVGAHLDYFSFAVPFAGATPSVSSVSPTSYPADTSNHLMKIFGSNFVSGDTLTFKPPEGGTIASNAGKLTFVSSTEIDYQFNDGNDPGSWQVRVNSTDGSLHSSYFSFAVASAVVTPSISSVSPTSYPADTSNHVMKIFGSNFVSGDTLTFAPPEGGTIASSAGKLTFVSSTEIDYQFNDGNDAGAWQVRVNSPDGSAHSSYFSFSVASAVVTPSITSVSPASYPADSANHVMKIFGSNFVSGDTLTFSPPEGGTIASSAGKLTFVSSTEIDYQFNDANDAGNWQVRVNSPDGSKHSSYFSFAVASAVVTPSISSVSPTAYPADSANHVMQIFGSNFVSGDTLTFTPPEGGTIASSAGKLTFVSSTEIDYQFNDGNDAGAWQVRVNSPDGSTHSSYFGFSVASAIATPSISSVSPASYPADTGNHVMQIFGSNFVSGDTLTFTPPEGGTIASSAGKLTFVSSTEIDYQFNDGNDAGAWQVRVNSPDNSAHSSYFGFSVASAIATPSISSVSPASYPADTSNHTMKIFGSNFVNGDTLTFTPPEGGTIASNAGKLVFVSSTEIDYQFNDASDAGNWQVRVNSPDGSAHSSYFSFAVASTVNHTPIAQGHDQTATPGTAIPLTQLFTYSDSDGPSDLVKFDVRDRTSGGGYLERDGQQKAANTVYEIALSDISHWHFVVGPAGSIDTIGFNVVDQAGAANPSVTAVATSLAGTQPTSKPYVLGNPQVALSTEGQATLSNLVTGIAASGATITKYEIFDTHQGQGYITVSGSKMVGTSISVNAAQLSSIGYYAGTQAGSNTIDIVAYDSQGLKSDDFLLTFTVAGGTIVQSGPNRLLPQDSTPQSATVNEIISMAKSYVGLAWGVENCTGLLWAISYSAGAPFMAGYTGDPEHTKETFLADAYHVKDAGAEDQLYVTPTAIPDVQGDDWQLVASAGRNWTQYVQPGDFVRIADVPGVGDHSFLVVGFNSDRTEFEIIDNTYGGRAAPGTTLLRGQVNDHFLSFSNATATTLAILNASVAYVQHLIGSNSAASGASINSDVQDSVGDAASSLYTATVWASDEETRHVDGTASLDELLVTLRGDAAHIVSVSSSGNSATIAYDGETTPLQADGFEALAIRLGDGDDQVTFTASPPSSLGSFFVNGYAGDDKIDGAALRVSLIADGGAGNDTLLGGAGDDILTGGPDTAPASAAEAASTQTVTLQPGPEGQDEWVTNVYYGGGMDDDRLRVGGWSDLYDALIKFDVAGAGLPSHVTSATLRLYDVSSNGGSPTGMYVDALSTAWDEHYRWNDHSLAYTNIGQTAAPGTGWLDIDVTAAVNNWLADPTSNFGLQLRPMLNANNFNFFVSSDATGAEADLRPQLVVSFDGSPVQTAASDDDFLSGGDGNDQLFGGMGSDKLLGDGGNDTLDGGAGQDNLYGGAGNDTFYTDRQDDFVFENAGEGTDTVITTASYYLYANIENLTLAAGAGGIFGVGNELANTITGNEGGNTLLGGAGADVVHGGAGVDIIYGEDGNDQLFGDADNDVIVGGAGNDAIDGGAGGDLLYGEDGDDTLWGGTDFVFDQLVGGAGNDILHGDSGLGDFDYLIGNTGDDTYYVDTYADLVFENAGEGTDTVYASTAAGSGYYLYANVENLVLTGQTFYGVGNELANTMTGSALDNWLLGGAGNDILNGKAGNDVLFGQDGADTFVFEHGTGGDTIADFTAGTDKIDLSAFGFTSFAQVQAAMSENGGSSAIILGGGDLIVLQNVTNAALHAGDFILSGGSAAQVEQLVQADPDEAPRGSLVHQFDAPWLMVSAGDLGGSLSL